MIRRMVASGGMGVHDQRCLHENGDILVEHSVMDFPDGTRVAVMAVHIGRQDHPDGNGRYASFQVTIGGFGRHRACERTRRSPRRMSVLPRRAVASPKVSAGRRRYSAAGSVHR